MSSQKRVLGRGLADLIPVGGNAAGDNGGGPIAELPIAQLHPNPKQPRTIFDDVALEELASSVRANGILQPILVRPLAGGSGYEIVAGERRYRAALKVGLIKIPVVVRTLSDEDTLAIGLIENLIREDITPIEEARAFHRLMTEFGWTQEEMGKKVGKSRPDY
jgi:ParB family transcriptional regulator, chromosome partitioning protein